MKWLVVLMLAVATSHAQFVFPDEWEMRNDQGTQQDPQELPHGGFLDIPAFEPIEPTVQNSGDADGPRYNENGGFQSVEEGPRYPQTGGFQHVGGGLGYPQNGGFQNAGGSHYPQNGGFLNVGEDSKNPQNDGLQNAGEGQSSVPEVTSQASVQSKPPSLPLDTILPLRWREHVLNIISRGSTQFTLDIDRAIENSSMALSNDNLLFSPGSLIVTLAMVLLASGGQTFQEVSKILGLESGIDISHHSEIVHQIFGLLIQEADHGQIDDPNLPQSKFAFGLFVQDSYPIREEFRAVSEKIYKSEVISVDFAHHSREAQTLVNDWVSNRTFGKIQNMLSEAPNPLTDVIITSALYFSGEWSKHFAEGATKRRPFKIEPNQTVYVDMMVNGGEFMFNEDKELGLKIIGLPYKGEEVTMYAVLPNAPGRAALRQLKNQLTPEVLDRLINNMVNSTCIVGFPRMKLSSNLKLQSALEALGLSSLFDPQRADLSVLSPGRNGATSQGPALPTTKSLPTSTQPLSTLSTSSQPLSTQSTSTQPLSTLPASVQPRSTQLGYHSYEANGYTIERWPNGYKLQQSQRRTKRQSRPMDQEFVDFLESLQLPNFGIDNLRNSAGLSNPGLYADEVIHRVEMTVNEKGTEAAAATSINLDRSGDFKRFQANRPFLFFIRHDPSRVIWFWGTINRPDPFYNSV